MLAAQLSELQPLQAASVAARLNHTRLERCRLRSRWCCYCSQHALSLPVDSGRREVDCSTSLQYADICYHFSVASSEAWPDITACLQCDISQTWCSAADFARVPLVCAACVLWYAARYRLLRIGRLQWHGLFVVWKKTNWIGLVTLRDGVRVQDCEVFFLWDDLRPVSGTGCKQRPDVSSQCLEVLQIVKRWMEKRCWRFFPRLSFFHTTLTAPAHRVIGLPVTWFIISRPMTENSG